MAIEIVEFPIWNGIGGIILGGTRQTGSISIQAGGMGKGFFEWPKSSDWWITRPGYVKIAIENGDL